MKRLIATQGIPGSGKSTWAKTEKERLESEGLAVMITSKDDIRAELTANYGWEWTPENEQDVVKMQNTLIQQAFKRDGKDVVIVADTNFGKHPARLEGIAKSCKAVFELRDFTTVPLQVCIERDARRTEGKVGDGVIREMYNKFVTPIIEPYKPDFSKTPAIIVDIDGTVALKGNRSPFDYSKVSIDTVNPNVAALVRTLADAGTVVLYVSGREDSCADATLNWLHDNKLWFGDTTKLWMRQTKDNRKDYIVKYEIFNKEIRNNYRIKFVLDDRDQVVKMWRELGLTCLQVAYGNF